MYAFSVIKKNVHLIILGICWVIGLYLRTSGTWGGFFSFTFDQGRDLLKIRELVYHHDLSLIGPPTGIDGVFHGAWWDWFLAPAFWVFGGNPRFITLSFNAFTTIAIFLAYWLGKELKNKKCGLVLGSLVAFSPAFISVSTQLWHPDVVPILTLGLILSIWKFLQKKWPFWLIGFLLGALFEFEFGSGSLFLPACILSLWMWQIRPNLKQTILSGLGFIFWFLPRILFELRNHFIQTKSFITYIQNPTTRQMDVALGARFLERTKVFWEVFLNGYGMGNLVLTIALGMVVVIGVVFTLPQFSKRHRKFYGFIGTLIILLLGMATMYPNAIWGYYVIGLPVLLLPFLGVGFWWYIEKKKWGWILVSGLWFMYLFPWNFNKPPWEGDAAVYRNQLAVIEYTYQHAQGKRFNVSVFSPSLIDYNYQYLFLWYGQKKYGYTPDRENVLPLVFFVIEPDPWNKGMRQVWIHERVGDGKTIETQIFPGKIEVEKRVRNTL